MPNGGYTAAMKRLRDHGWRPMALTVLGANIRCAAKAGAIIAFGPEEEDCYASEPGVLNGLAGFIALPRGDALREEGIDCLCDSLP